MSRPPKYEIELTYEADAHLEWLTARDKSIVLDSLEKHLGHEPLVETRNRKQLRPNPIAPRELRLGRVRVYFEVEQEPRRVVRIVAVGFKDRSKVWIGGAAVELK